MTDLDPRLSRRELLRAGALLAGLSVTGRAFARPSALPYDEYANLDALALADLVRCKHASPSELPEAAGPWADKRRPV
ncbi:MAG: hypothetical protein JRG86_12725 [Deltaproteobacteria bacterium]|nr:hypothetical protein [Deltaproteobacteria bacterium]MBW2498727.1 hypothetical protein [Deltaproteobacteria bacterium]